MNNIKKIKIFVNDNEKSKNIYKKLVDKLLQNGFLLDDNSFDLAIAVGGDGTFLRMVKECHFNSEIYYVGVHTGTFGFAQDINILEIDSFIDSLKKNSINFEDIGIGEVNFYNGGELIHYNFLNEIVLRDKELNTLKLDTYVDNSLLENYVGDGILVATSFGSTAYNLSFGGSIIYHNFHTLQITPIAPLNNKSYRSLMNSVVIPSSKCITFFPIQDSKNLLLSIDGDNYCYNDIEKINVFIHNNIKVIRKMDYNFISKINDKFLK